MPFTRLGPRTQSWVQFAGFTFLLLLAVGALVYANTSQNAADHAQGTAEQGAAACQRLVATYAESTKLRKAIRTEWRTTSMIRAQTARVFTDLANLSPKASPAQVKILNLALAYSNASAKVRALADQITIPPPPNCKGA